MKSGFVSIIGRPNTGKSTLLNQILKEHLAITSAKPQTTRNLIEGIYNEENAQIVFVDTPGIHKPINKLGSVLNNASFSAINGVDLVLFIVDAKTGIGKGDTFILDKLKDADVPVILVLNKVDGLANDKLITTIDEVKDIYPFKEIVPISALKGKNVDELIKVIREYLPTDFKLYSDDVVTNISDKFYVGEIVREKILNLTNREVPHTVTCFVQTLENEEDIVRIQVDIIVERDNLKKIIIGKNGSMLKKIGSLAREDLEEYFSKKVYLETYVKTIDNWRDKEKYLKELGFTEDL